MKSIRTLVALTALLIAVVSVQNAHSQIELTLGGGMNSPLGDYGDQTKAGYALTASLGYRFMPFAVFGFETSYSANKFSDDALAALGSGYEASSSILQYSGMAKAVLPVGKHNLFAKGIVGNYRGSAKVSGPLGEGSVTVTDLGYGLGGGFIVNTAKNSSLFADVTYHHVAFSNGEGDTSFITVTIGALIKFDLSKPKLEDELEDELAPLRE